MRPPTLVTGRSGDGSTTAAVAVALAEGLPQRLNSLSLDFALCAVGDEGVIVYELAYFRIRRTQLLKALSQRYRPLSQRFSIEYSSDLSEKRSPSSTKSLG